MLMLMQVGTSTGAGQVLVSRVLVGTGNDCIHTGWDWYWYWSGAS